MFLFCLCWYVLMLVLAFHSFYPGEGSYDRHKYLRIYRIPVYFLVSGSGVCPSFLRADWSRKLSRSLMNYVRG